MPVQCRLPQLQGPAGLPQLQGPGYDRCRKATCTLGQGAAAKWACQQGSRLQASALEQGRLHAGPACGSAATCRAPLFRYLPCAACSCTLRRTMLIVQKMVQDVCLLPHMLACWPCHDASACRHVLLHIPFLDRGGRPQPNAQMFCAGKRCSILPCCPVMCGENALPADHDMSVLATSFLVHSTCV